MNYVDNPDFVFLLKEYQETNDDKGEWIEAYRAKLLIKFKNGKIDQEKLDSGLEFYDFKKQFFIDKKERLSILDAEENIKRNQRIRYLKEIIGRTFIAIANGRIKTPQFVRYPQQKQEEMISDALYIMLRYADRFDCRRPNPFSYFTQAAFNAFRAYLKERKKYEEKYQSIDYIENLDGIVTDSDSGLD